MWLIKLSFSCYKGSKKKKKVIRGSSMNSIRPSIFSSVFADANYNSTLSYSPTKVGWHFDIF